MNFFAELKRRHIYRVAAAYAVVAWVLIQFVNNITPMLNLPNLVGTVVLVLLAVGFPVAILFAWINQLAPADGTAVRAPPSKLDWVLIGALVIVIGIFAYQQIAPSRTAVTQQAGVTAAREAAASPRGAISIAVLPFANMSGDTGQEFFSDGMTEEITAALSKVPDLRVVARTSAFEFKNQNRNIRAVGDELGATHLIEGSVRKAGERVRITVQLIKSDDGTHIWSENYDRQLTDIFAVQEEIARAITTSLRMPLGLKPGENLVNNRDIDSESYEKFLRARALVIARGGEPTPAQELRNVTEAVTLLESVIAKNPSYAPAWAWLGGANFVLTGANANNFDVAKARALANETTTRGEAALKKAIQLNPNIAEVYSSLGWFMKSHGNLVEADEYIKKALALDPLSAEVMFINAMFAASTGRINDALDFANKGHALDPLYPNLARETVQSRWLNGQNDAAIALAKTLRSNDRATRLAYIYASMGRYGDAADALMELAGREVNSDAAKAARLVRMLPAKPIPAGELPRIPAGSAVLYVYFGTPERALEVYEQRADVGFVNGSQGYLWHKDFAPLRKTERFKALMKKAGVVDYWRAKGWPDLCHPTTRDDFECN